MLPIPGRYRLMLPPFPYGMDVLVEAIPPMRPVLKTPIGSFPYVELGDVFVVGPETAIRCTGEGTYESVIGGVTVLGTCERLPGVGSGG